MGLAFLAMELSIPRHDARPDERRERVERRRGPKQNLQLMFGLSGRARAVRREKAAGSSAPR